MNDDAELETQALTVRLPAELLEQLTAYCRAHGDSVDQFVARAVWEELCVMNGSAAPSRLSRQKIDPEREYTVDEVIELCRDERILMRVTGFDDRQNPTKGVVLTHSFHRGEVSRRLAQEPPRTEHPPDAPHQPYYIFRAFPRVQPGPEHEDAFLAIVAQVKEQLAAAKAARRASERR